MVVRSIVLLILIGSVCTMLIMPARAITSEPDAAGLFSEPAEALPTDVSEPVLDTNVLPSSVLNNRTAQPATAATTSAASPSDSAASISSTDAMVIIIAAVLLLGGAVVWLMTRHKKTA